MQIHQLKPKTPLIKKKRIGRGGKRGTYSGRGIKGQKARAGAKIKPQARELILKFPKKRGVKFPFRKIKPLTISLSEIKRKFPEGGTITPQKLAKAGLINLPKYKNIPVKILGSGSISLEKPYRIKNCLVSQNAKQMILKSGGTIVS